MRKATLVILVAYAATLASSATASFFPIVEIGLQVANCDAPPVARPTTPARGLDFLSAGLEGGPYLESEVWAACVTAYPTGHQQQTCFNNVCFAYECIDDVM